MTASQARQHNSRSTPGCAGNVPCMTGNCACKVLISIEEVSMSSKQTGSEEQVTMSRSEFEEIVAGKKLADDENAELRKLAASNKLGSLVLLRNKKLEEFWDKKIAEGNATEEERVVKYTAHSSFYVNEAFWNHVKCSIDSDPLRRCQVDVSMNQSKFMSHDRLDPEFNANGDPNNNAPTFWLDGSSEFTIETLAQHEIRDPDSAYDMSKGAENAVSKGVISKRKVA